MFNRFTFAQKLAALLLLFLCLVAYFIGLTISHAGKTKVSIVVIPGGTSVFINDKSASAGSTYLSPGKYTFKATKEGWADYSLSVSIGKEPVKIGLLPEPRSSEARKYLDDNPDIQLERESLGGINSDLIGQQLAAQTPLVNALPYEDVYGPFRVDYGQQKGRLYLDVNSSTPPGREKFLQWLKQQGQDPTDLEIKYADFSNPFITGAD